MARHDIQTNDSVVSTLTVTDGSGEGQLEATRFSYEGLRHNVQGRGSLGFRKFYAHGPDGRRSAHDGADAPPGFSVHWGCRIRRFGAAGIGQDRVLDRAPLVEARSRQRDEPAALSVSREHDGAPLRDGGAFDGSEIARTVRSVAAVDATSGRITDETTTTTEIAGGANAGSSSSLRTLHSSILNDTVNWCLGRTQAIEVTASHTLPGGTAITREADQDWDGLKCRPTRVRLMPGDGSWRVTYNLSYDAFGNIAQTKR